MAYIKEFVIGGVVVAACAAIAGCTSQPSDDEVRAAVTKQIEAAGGGFIHADKALVDKIKIIKCAKAEAGGVQCDLDNGSGGGGTVRFVKGESGWVAMSK